MYSQTVHMYGYMALVQEVMHEQTPTDKEDIDLYRPQANQLFARIMELTG